MPIHLEPISRRWFLGRSVAAASAGWLALESASCAEQPAADPHTIALLSDTHIFRDRAVKHRGVDMYSHLAQVGEEVRSHARRPSHVLVNGDCAFLEGGAEDYQQFLSLIKPYTEAGFPVHLALGNHDNRERFWEGAMPFRSTVKGLDNRQVSIVVTERANWFVLDSLERTNYTPGTLGADQLRWLGESLDAHGDRPAIVMAHHNPVSGAGVSMGLSDTEQLFEVIMPRRQVKAYVFGHTHHWQARERDGLHLINLPPTAYPFNSTDPSGWVEVNLEPDGASFTLHALDKAHPANGQRHDLKWRAA